MIYRTFLSDIQAVSRCGRWRAATEQDRQIRTVLLDQLVQLAFAGTAERHAFTVIPPQILLLYQTGSLARDERGEVSFTAAILFRKTSTRQHFEGTALQALRELRPDLFAR